ncbi:MAG: 50S ribosomal protein L13 [Bryobacterales bacterium]|nr:50S ribosomal protein L13 [Acidobacteriota bacterium]MCB9384778.1 50S ribosomal protein L13 [Bryobacterales bacterium]
MSTTYIPRADEVRNDWYLIDAEDVILGRLATRAAMMLMGKHKPDYTPFLKTGDHVIVINAEKVALTGKKEDDKVYYRHSQYPGGIKAVNVRELRQTFPERIVENAVSRMLPKNKIGRQLAKRLKVYAGPQHPHDAQAPKTITIER